MGYCNCGCGSWNSCTCSSSCTTTLTNCTDLCGSLIVQNSWNVPACDANATLTLPKLKNVLVGGYIWNPTYGYFYVTSFNAVTGEMVVTNLCNTGNATAGTIVPALTMFTLTAPPIEIDNLITVSNAWAMPACAGNVTLTTPNLKSALVGSNIWNPTVGYLEIVSYNTSTFELVVTNNCVAGNAAPTTAVLAGALFTVTPEPAGGEDLSWSPVVSAASGTISAQTINEATYNKVGNLRHFTVSVSFTTSATPASIGITLPTAAIGMNGSVNLIGAGADAGVVITNGIRWRVLVGTPGSIFVSKAAGTNWTAAAGHTIDIQGFYREV